MKNITAHSETNSDKNISMNQTSNKNNEKNAKDAHYNNSNSEA